MHHVSLLLSLSCHSCLFLFRNPPHPRCPRRRPCAVNRLERGDGPRKGLWEDYPQPKVTWHQPVWFSRFLLMPVSNCWMAPAKNFGAFMTRQAGASCSRRQNPHFWYPTFCWEQRCQLVHVFTYYMRCSTHVVSKPDCIFVILKCRAKMDSMCVISIGLHFSPWHGRQGRDES